MSQRFTDEFKIEAVKRVTGQSVTNVSEQLGIASATL